MRLTLSKRYLLRMLLSALVLAKPAVAERLTPVILKVPEKFKSGPFKKERRLYAPPGFEVSVFATGLGKARFMAVGPDGSIYLSVPNRDYILVLPDKNGDGVTDRQVVFARNMKRVHGLTFAGKALYAAGTGNLYRIIDKNGNLRGDKVEVISTDIPGGGGHWTRSVVAGPDGQLYLSAGSSCNVCIEEDKRRAAILRFPLSGGSGSVFATGLRNSVGIAFHPETGELWASNNGRDWLGDELPPEEINLVREGGDYGWPYCYGDRIPDPGYGSPERCKGTIPPEVKMQAHSAPLGITFGSGLKFPEKYVDMLFVAFHGSWNRSIPTGYKLIGIPFKDGSPIGEPEDIITGWMSEGKVWGRPVAPIVGSDGALYLSDDKTGTIYRITYNR